MRHYGLKAKPFKCLF